MATTDHDVEFILVQCIYYPSKVYFVEIISEIVFAFQLSLTRVHYLSEIQRH